MPKLALLNNDIVHVLKINLSFPKVKIFASLNVQFDKTERKSGSEQ